MTTAIYHQSAGITDGINARSVDVMMKRQNSERRTQIHKRTPPYFGRSFPKRTISITVRVRVRVSSRVRVKVKFKVRVSIMARISNRTCGVTNVFEFGTAIRNMADEAMTLAVVSRVFHSLL